MTFTKPIIELVKFGEEEVPTTTSLNVAEVFGKRHDTVLRTVKRLGCSEEFRHRNFAEAVYQDGQGKDRPMYIMTRDGFTFLAMSFTGREAAKFKEAYIAQFNAMEKKLKRMEAAEQKRIAIREGGKLARRTLTDEIRDSGENERMHNHGYSTYTQLAHKTAIGETIPATRKRLGIGKKDNIRDRLTADELKRIEGVESAMKGLLAVGLQYDSIKAIMETVSGQKRELHS